VWRNADTRLTLPSEQPIRPFSQYLKDVAIGMPHDCEYIVDKSNRHVVMKEVAHAVNKNPSRLSPPKRERQALGVGPDLSKVPSPPPSREPLGVAELAAW